MASNYDIPEMQHDELLNNNIQKSNEDIDKRYLMQVLTNLETEKKDLEDDCSLLTELLIRKYYKNISDFRFILNSKKKR